MEFNFYTPVEIFFGNGKLNQLGEIASRFGEKAIISIRGDSVKSSGLLQQLKVILRQCKISCAVFNAPSSEPQIEDIDEGATFCRKEKPDFVIGIGGGSAIDTGKAISSLATNSGTIMNYLEGVGDGWQLENPSLPYIAIPTTGGTGTEATKNAVIASRKLNFKRSIRSPFLFPDVAIVDPLLTLSVPPQITAETGMDAMTQLIEAYVTKKRQPLINAIALEGIKIAGKKLRRAVQNGRDEQARQAMSFASLLSGISLANAGLGAAHGIAASLGAYLDIPHGRACSIALPKVMHLNLPACQEQYAEIGAVLGASEKFSLDQKAVYAIEYMQQLSKDIGIPDRLKVSDLQKDELNQLVSGSRGSSMKGNPIELSDDDIRNLLQSIL